MPYAAQQRVAVVAAEPHAVAGIHAPRADEVTRALGIEVVELGGVADRPRPPRRELGRAAEGPGRGLGEREHRDAAQLVADLVVTEEARRDRLARAGAFGRGRDGTRDRARVGDDGRRVHHEHGVDRVVAQRALDREVEPLGRRGPAEIQRIGKRVTRPRRRAGAARARRPRTRRPRGCRARPRC